MNDTTADSRQNTNKDVSTSILMEKKDFSKMTLQQLDDELTAIENLYSSEYTKNKYIPDFIGKFELIYDNLKRSNQNCINYWKILQESSENLQSDVLKIKTKVDEKKVDIDVIRNLRDQLLYASKELENQLEVEQKQNVRIKILEEEVRKLKQLNQKTEDNSLNTGFF